MYIVLTITARTRNAKNSRILIVWWNTIKYKLSCDWHVSLYKLCSIELWTITQAFIKSESWILAPLILLARGRNTSLSIERHRFIDHTVIVLLCPPAKTKRVGSLISVDGGVTDSEYLGLRNPLMNFKEGCYVSGGVLLISYYKPCKRANKFLHFQRSIIPYYFNPAQRPWSHYTTTRSPLHV